MALSEQSRTLSSLQQSVRQERAAKDELSVQLTAVQRQLREGREVRLAETRRLQGRLELLEGELGQAREHTRHLEEAGQEREEELERVRTHLQSVETEQKEQVSEVHTIYTYTYSTRIEPHVVPLTSACMLLPSVDQYSMCVHMH